MLDQGLDEPVAHHLFREAYEHRRENRRSALVVGVAALEVGVKAYLAKIAPDTRWLVANLPSPPVHRILGEYLPSVQSRLTIGGKVLAPPAPLLSAVKDAVSMRNRIAHATGEDVERDTLDRVLHAIYEILWLLDYYAGAEWALVNLSEQTRVALGLSGLAAPDPVRAR